MIRRMMLALCCAAGVSAATAATEARAQQAFGRQWGHSYNTQDWQRFYHYPYVYYPHNYSAPIQYDNLYYRYPQERQIPVYNTGWHNFYPSPHPYYRGHHFILDVF